MRSTRLLATLLTVSVVACSGENGDGEHAAGGVAIDVPTTDGVVDATAAPVPYSGVDSPPPKLDGLLPAERLTTWDPGVTYGEGGIPNRSTICADVSPDGDDDTSRIQAAIDECPAGQVVRLEAGTFDITGEGLTIRTGITLRGAGSGEPGTGDGGTRLLKVDRETERNFAVIYVGGNAQQFVSSTDLAEDAQKGSTTVRLEEDPGLEVGEHVLVDHVTTDDPAVYWGPFHDGPGEGSRRWFARQDRSLSQILEVSEVDGTTVTFATPFHWTFRTELGGQLSRYGDPEQGQVMPFVDGAGIEDMYVWGGMGGDYHGNIAVSTCARCWVRGVESDFAEGTAIGFYATYRSELRDSFVHGTSSPNPGGGGYLTGLNAGASDNLIENNILWQANKMVVMRASGGGNVFSYNYLEDGYGDDYKDIVEVGLNAGHYTTPHMELLEGNQAFNVDGDSYWGNSISIVVFRNHLTGERRDVEGLGLVDMRNRRLASLNHHQYDYSFLGNVLGVDGIEPLPGQERFVYEASDLDQPYAAVWQLGYVGEDPGQPFDPKVAETAIRSGNFDYVTGNVDRADGVPGQLPPSLYLTERPAFFGDLAWPWVTPEDDSRRVHELPARARFDAMGIG